MNATTAAVGSYALDCSHSALTDEKFTRTVEKKAIPKAQPERMIGEK